MLDGPSALPVLRGERRRRRPRRVSSLTRVVIRHAARAERLFVAQSLFIRWSGQPTIRRR